MVFFFVMALVCFVFFFFSSRRRHTRFDCDWSSDVCSSDLIATVRATASERKERTATGKGVCYRTTTEIRELNGTESVTTTGFSVTLNPRTSQYTVSAPTILEIGRASCRERV